jgi:hypothetical protein
MHRQDVPSVRRDAASSRWRAHPEADGLFEESQKIPIFFLYLINLA